MGTRQAVNILVVEDDLITAAAISQCLEDAGYQVVGVVSSGQEAIDQTANIQPDLVLMDIKLKGSMNGVLVTQQIQSRFDIPVIYLTALSDDATLKRILHSQPHGYIVKPFKEEELYAAIENVLRQDK